MFHEFVFLLSRIAITKVNTSGKISGKLENLFVETLGFQRVPDINRARVTFDDITRRLDQSDEEGNGSDEVSGEEEWDSEE